MPDSERRHLVVVDCETSALRPSRPGMSGLLAYQPADLPYGVVTECAWWDLDTDDAGRFVPRHDSRWVRAYGEPGALVVSRYLERLVDAGQDENGVLVKDLHTRLDGHCLAGANPAFDAKFLSALFADHGLDPEPWHHRLVDLEAYAAGTLGINPRELLGLAKLCDRLGVNAPDHTAAGDVRATGDCFRKLMAMGG